MQKHIVPMVLALLVTGIATAQNQRSADVEQRISDLEHRSVRILQINRARRFAQMADCYASSLTRSSLSDFQALGLPALESAKLAEQSHPIAQKPLC